MTLCERIKLVDDMIRENPDSTIKDYMELMGELVKIERATIINPPIVVLKQMERKPRKERDSKTIRKYHSVFRPNI